MAAPVVLVELKDILPDPAPPNPIAGFVFVQLKTVPGTAPVKVAVTVAPAQTVWLACAFTVGVGLTVMVNVFVGPVQSVPPLLNTGYIVIVATCGVMPVLMAVKLAILPVPLAARPMLILLLVQLYTVPGTVPVNTTVAVAAPLHTTWLAG